MADTSHYPDSAHVFKMQPERGQKLSPNAQTIYEQACLLGEMPPHVNDFFSITEISDRLSAEAAWQATIPVHDVKHKRMFEVDGSFVTLYWGGYGYDYDLANIRRPEDLLWFLIHIGKKTWRHSSPSKIAALIDEVCLEKGWQPYRPVPHPNESPPAFHDAKAEREALTPALRYRVIKRDGSRCRLCGAGVATGAVLHVDHVIPIAKGGTTVEGNLQCLCAVCNQGKAAT